VGELWQADEAYRKCLKMDGQNAVVWQGIIELYTAYGLWHTARAQLEAAVGYFPKAPWLIADEEKIITGIQTIFDEAQYNLEHKNLPAARLRIAEYLSYYPDEGKAHKLKREVMRQQLIIKGNDAVDGSQVEIGLRELLSAKKKFILSGEYEQVIGVLEGLIEHDPSNAAHYRQEIGNYRRYQGDHTSAAWNFDQACQLRTLNQELTS
jgi:tetratricopeptide (TPR) repeat protein